MRWFFLLLLAANILTFLWFYPNQAPEQTVSVADEDQGLPKLVLLSELNSGQNRLAAQDTPAANEAMRSEQQVNAAGSPATDAKTTTAAKQLAAAQCFRIGPYASVDQTERSGMLLAKAGWQAERSEVKDRVLVGKRMVLPGKMNESIAQARLNELQRKGIRDIAVIKDQDRYIVSLGFYSRQSSVDRRQQELKRHGYQIEAVPVYRESREYWLNASRVDGKQELEKIWKSLVKLVPGVGSSETNCR